ncbi:MAG: DUF1326 domain-containing protein [Bryobacteraceae bacterium]|nr:DUF1326 domain-containing protein [Solibacteraceae bacterium]MCO5350091.1 DUF1326 domain-containing protein [Bryobacteraceae bacterium]
MSDTIKTGHAAEPHSTTAQGKARPALDNLKYGRFSRHDSLRNHECARVFPDTDRQLLAVGLPSWNTLRTLNIDRKLPSKSQQLIHSKRLTFGSNLGSNPIRTPSEPRSDPERTPSEPHSDPIRTSSSLTRPAATYPNPHSSILNRNSKPGRVQPMMTQILRAGLAAFALSGVALAANVPATDLKGAYVEARTADVYTGACFANSEVQLVGNLAVFGWKINKGAWQGVNLDGLAVVAAVRASSTLGDRTGSAYPVKAVLMVDERASLEQRDALRRFAVRQTGDLLQDIVKVEALPIEFEVKGSSIHAASVALSAGTLARLETRAIEQGDHVCAHEETWYDPLAQLDHAMPAFTLAHRFEGLDLNSRWSSPDKRSAFVGTFHVTE